jgi:hypothetical protein
MPVPSSIDDLSTTAGSNYPSGTESVITADDYLRTYASFIALLRDRAAILQKSTEIANGSLTASVGSNALTIALKTAAGADPSASDPVYVAFRSSTAGTGTVQVRTVTAALSITVPSTGTMGQSNAVAARLWVALIDNAGTVEMAVVNTQLGAGQIFPVNESLLISTTALGTGSDSAGVWYSTTLRSNVPMRLLGYIENTQATAGTWATAPSVIQTMGPGVRKPGEVVQVVENYTGAVATGTTILPGDDTIPQITEGNEYMTQAITPTSAINRLHIEALANLATSAAAGTGVLAAIFQDATANALKATNNTTAGAGYMKEAYLSHSMAAGTTSATTFRLRAGASVANTTTFNGIAGARLLGGALNSFMRVTEVMA